MADDNTITLKKSQSPQTISRTKYFWEEVLSKPASALPKGAQWYVIFDGLEQIESAIKQATLREPNAWNLDAQKILLTRSYQNAENIGCVFCQAIDQPGEATAASVEGNISANGLIRSYVGQGRAAFEPLRMTFLDTNVSFTDTFLRGWALATANFGMIARSKKSDKNYRVSSVSCYKLGYYSPDEPVSILSKMTFYDVCCISVSREELNYSQKDVMLREAQFIYNNYKIESTPSSAGFAGNAAITNRYSSNPSERWQQEVRKAEPLNKSDPAASSGSVNDKTSTVPNSKLPGVLGSISNGFGRIGDTIENAFKGQLGSGAQSRPK